MPRHRIETATGDIADLRRLLRDDDNAAAVALSDRVLADSADARTRAYAAVYRLAALLNAGETEAWTGAVRGAFAALREYPSPGLLGSCHAMAAFAAYHRREISRCVPHLIQGVGDLEGAEASEEVAAAWHDIALTYSFLGLHRQAEATVLTAREVAVAAGVPALPLTGPQVPLRAATAEDHRGDTSASLRALDRVVAELGRRIADGTLDQTPGYDRLLFGYAVARRAALLGALPEVAGLPAGGIDVLLAAGGRAVPNERLRMLGRACLAVAAGDGPRAVALAAAVDGPDLISAEPAEAARVHALALAAAGDEAAARGADRECFRRVSARTDRLLDGYVDGEAARIERTRLRRAVARYAEAALTDPLTELPNRRYLVQHLRDLAAAGQYATLGVLDLDGFKAVNTAHGHIAGDLVLRRVAHVLTGALRAGDVIARYGGDEFVAVLPGTDLAGAEEIGRRLAAAVAAQDWESVVPGTPIGVSVGWATVPPGGGLGEAVRAADAAMYEAKTRSAGRIPQTRDQRG